MYSSWYKMVCVSTGGLQAGLVMIKERIITEQSSCKSSSFENKISAKDRNVLVISYLRFFSFLVYPRSSNWFEVGETLCHILLCSNQNLEIFKWKSAESCGVVGLCCQATIKSDQTPPAQSWWSRTVRILRSNFKSGCHWWLLSYKDKVVALWIHNLYPCYLCFTVTIHFDQLHSSNCNTLDVYYLPASD